MLFTKVYCISKSNVLILARNPDEPIEMVYIPSHLYHMLFELFKVSGLTFWFLSICGTSLLKTQREKEKLLVMSNFSFYHSVFCPFGKVSVNFIKFKIVICEFFQFGRVLNLSFGKGLTHYQTTNFRLFQTERVYRQQFQI